MISHIADAFLSIPDAAARLTFTVSGIFVLFRANVALSLWPQTGERYQCLSRSLGFIFRLFRIQPQRITTLWGNQWTIGFMLLCVKPPH